MRGANEYYSFTAEGPYGYIINLLTRAGVKVIEPRMCDGGCEFTVTAKDRAKALSALEEKGRAYKEIRRGGTKIKIKNFFLRYAFIAGLILSFTAVAVYANTIDGITIEGAERLSEDSILAVCAEYANTPCFSGSLDLKQIEKSVLELDGIAYASVTKSGRKINVKVVEELPKTEIEDALNPVPLVATEDGTITKIAVYRGTPAVAVGVTVNAGDVLIYPYVGADEATRKSVKARGYVEARVTRVETLEYSSEEEYSVNCARDVKERVDAFKAGLKESDVFTGSRISEERLDKSIVISIYYEIITNIA